MIFVCVKVVRSACCNAGVQMTRFIPVSVAGQSQAKKTSTFPPPHRSLLLRNIDCWIQQQNIYAEKYPIKQTITQTKNMTV